MSVWSEETRAKAARLWQDDHSAGEIAAKLGLTRNAVLGLAHRNRDLFPTRPRVEKQARLPKREPMARPVRPARPSMAAAAALARREAAVEPASAEEKPEPDFQPSKPVTILGLGRETCRWPLWPMGDNPGAAGLYCGETTDGDSAWCRHHRMRARAA